MTDIAQARMEGRAYYTSVRDDALQFNTRGLNSRVALLPIGEEGDLTAPVAGVIQINDGPGDILRGRHLHPGDAINLVVDGAMYMDGTWLRPGQAKIVPANLAYGDAIPWQGGCAFLEIFENSVLSKPAFTDERAQDFFEKVHGSLAADAFGEAAAQRIPELIAELGKKKRRQRGIEVARFDELDDTWVQTGLFWTRFVFIGPENDPDAPVGVAIKADRNAGDFIASKRSFGTTSLMVVLAGTVLHDGKWLSVGDIHMAPAGHVGGDLVFGPEGGVVFFMFDKRAGMIPRFADEHDQRNFDTLFRRGLEEVAMGKVEKSVPLFPVRDTYTPGRCIAFATHEEVAKYLAESGPDW